MAWKTFRLKLWLGLSFPHSLTTLNWSWLPWTRNHYTYNRLNPNWTLLKLIRTYFCVTLNTNKYWLSNYGCVCATPSFFFRENGEKGDVSMSPTWGGRWRMQIAAPWEFDSIPQCWHTDRSRGSHFFQPTSWRLCTGTGMQALSTLKSHQSELSLLKAGTGQIACRI